MWDTALPPMPPSAAGGGGQPPRRSPRLAQRQPHPGRRDERDSGAPKGRDGGGQGVAGASTSAATMEDSPRSEESSFSALHASPVSRARAEEAAAAFHLRQISGFAGHGALGNVYLARWFLFGKFECSLRTVAKINSSTFAHHPRLDWPFPRPLRTCLMASSHCWTCNHLDGMSTVLIAGMSADTLLAWWTQSPRRQSCGAQDCAEKYQEGGSAGGGDGRLHGAGGAVGNCGPAPHTGRRDEGTRPRHHPRYRVP